MRKIYSIIILVLIIHSLVFSQQTKIRGNAKVGGKIKIGNVGTGGGFVAGFNFRQTSGFVTDGANQTYVLATDTYPTTRGGFTFGYENASIIDGRNRDSGVDVRLAGIHFIVNFVSDNPIFRVDLPTTGNTNVSLAFGDGAGGNVQNIYAVVKDDSTAFITLTGVAVDSNKFIDAQGTSWLTASWPGSNVAVTRNFTSTILRISLGGTTASASTCIAHLGITQ